METEEEKETGKADTEAMTRQQAISLLASRLADAPNFGDYCQWLCRQSDEMLLLLAEGEKRPVEHWKEMAA